MNLTKIKIFLSTLSFTLCIVGYNLATTFFLPSTGDFENVTRAVTVPYRAFALALMLVVIVINIRERVKSISTALFFLILYWILIIARIFSDVFLRSDYFFTDTSQLWLFIFAICLAALYTTIKSFNYIDTDKALYWTWFGIITMLTITLFSNQALLANTGNELRADANIALNTISYGNFGVTGILLTIYIFINKKSKLFTKFLLIFAGILCVYSVLRSGSRGPILGLLIVFLFWFFAKGRNIKVGSFVLACIFALLFFVKDIILSVMGEISPVIELRLRESLEGNGPDDGRTFLHNKALDIFSNHPFLGSQFAIFDGEGAFAYAHNLFLDSLMALGIVGGLIMIYIVFKALQKCYKNIHENKKYYWVSLILVQQLTSLMVSGTFYEDQLLSVLLVFHFMTNDTNKDR